MNAEAEKVLIVGGATGAGLALARALLADGAEVTIAGRSAHRLSAACKSLACAGRLRTIVADISREDQVQRLFRACGPLHHIVATAADMQGASERLPSVDIAVARRIVDSRFIGPLLLAKHGAPRLAKDGSITLMSGAAACHPAAHGPVAAAINGALESLAHALAVELEPIRVNLVSPGGFKTPIEPHVAPGKAGLPLRGAPAKHTEAGRAGQPIDIAAAIRFLMRNALVTGTVLRVDGGQQRA